jgi:hypothetical protein
MTLGREAKAQRDLVAWLEAYGKGGARDNLKALSTSLAHLNVKSSAAFPCMYFLVKISRVEISALGNLKPREGVMYYAALHTAYSRL